MKFRLTDILSGRFLSDSGFVKRLPAILYIVLLTIIYMYNIFDGQKRYREILRVEREISRLKVTATTLQAERISATKESRIMEEIARRKIPLFETTIPPKPLEPLPSVPASVTVSTHANKQ